MGVAFGYDNLLDSLSSYVFTTGTEDGSNPFANCYDHNVYDYMALVASASGYQIDVDVGSSLSANYIAFYKHNFADVSATIQLYYDDTGFTDASGLITPTSSAPVIVTFGAQSSQDWRIEIDNQNNDVTIGDIKFGTILETDFGVHIGHSPLTQARDVEYSHSIAEGGLSLGRAITNRGVSASYNIEHMSQTFLRNSWNPFVVHAERYPFYMAWDEDNYSTEVAYCENSGPIGKPVFNNHNRASASLPVRGFIV